MPNKIILYTIIFLLNLSLSKAQTEYIVTINPATGILTKIDSIPGVRWLQSYSTFNQTTKDYTVMGLWERGQPPVYLYTLNTETGAILSKPLLISPNNIISLQYSRSTGILYSIIHQNGVYYLATINKTSGAYLLIKDIPYITGVGSFVIDEENQRMYLQAVDNNPSFALWTIDLLTGNIIYHVSTNNLGELRYDNSSHKLYALSSRPGPTPASFYIISICTVDPATGVNSIIADLPAVTNIVSGDHGSFNENDHIYFFIGLEQSPPVYLYSVNAVTGNIISKAPISTSGVIDHDNLIFFRYDNISRKLYGLFWEAKTIHTPPMVIDSTCRLDIQTKIYPIPSGNTLSVDKNPTKCKVTMNLYNIIGQLMMKGKIINDGHNEIQIGNISSGIYYYEFFSDANVLLKGKILKN